MISKKQFIKMLRHPFSIYLLGFIIIIYNYTDYNKLLLATSVDYFVLDYPNQLFIQSNKGLPLWNPFAVAGEPFLGQFQHRYFYPFRFLFNFFIGVEKGILCEYIFHFVLFHISSYVLFRNLGTGKYAALFASFITATPGFALLSDQPWFLATISWLPFAILFLKKTIEDPNIEKSLTLSIYLSLMFFAGGAVLFAFIIDFLFWFTVGTLIWKTIKQRHFPLMVSFYLSISAITALILVLPQLLPTLELSLNSIRSYQPLTLESFFLKYQPFQVWNLHVYSHIRNEAMPGLIATFLVLLSIFLIFTYRPQKRWLAGFIGFYIVYINILASSSGTYIGKLFFEIHPISRFIRLVSRYIFLLPLLNGIIIALGFHTLHLIFRKKRTEISFSKIHLHKYINKLPVLAKLKIHHSFVFWGLIATLSFLIFSGVKIRLRTPITTQGSLETWRQKETKNIKEKLSLDSHERILISCNRSDIAPCLNFGLASRISNFNQWNSLTNYRNFLYFKAIGSTPMARNMVWLGDFGIFSHPSEIKYLQRPELLLAASIKYLFLFDSQVSWIRKHFPKFHLQKLPDITFSTIEGDLFLHTGQAPSEQGKKLMKPFLELNGAENLRHAYQIAAFPRAYLHNEIHLTKNLRESYRYLKSSDPRKTIILEVNPKDHPNPVLETISRQDQLKAAHITLYEPQRVEIKAESSGDSILILTDAFFPGWKAYVDGIQVPVYPVNVLFRGIKLNKGKHSIVFQYEPNWFPIIYLSLCLWIVICIYLASIRILRFMNRK